MEKENKDHGEVIFGVKEPLTPRGFPPGKIRFRIRNDDWVKARVRTAAGIKEFVVAEKDGHWIPSYELGRNERA